MRRQHWQPPQYSHRVRHQNVKVWNGFEISVWKQVVVCETRHRIFWDYFNKIFAIFAGYKIRVLQCPVRSQNIILWLKHFAAHFHPRIKGHQCYPKLAQIWYECSDLDEDSGSSRVCLPTTAIGQRIWKSFQWKLTAAPRFQLWRWWQNAISPMVPRIPESYLERHLFWTVIGCCLLACWLPMLAVGFLFSAQLPIAEEGIFIFNG